MLMFKCIGWTLNGHGTMARIENRTQRQKLAAGKRHWQVLEPGLAVGYRRPNRGGAGSWYVRAQIGDTHRLSALGTADDLAEADGVTILNWKQAQVMAREWATRQTGAGPRTVAQAVDAYVADLRARRGDAAAKDADGRLKKYLLPFLARKRLADVTEADVRAVRNAMVKGDDEETIRRSRDSANRVLRIVKATLGKSGPWRDVETFTDVGEARKIILSDAEQQRLIDACEPDLRDFALLVAWTGARPGKELTERRVRDFDPAARTLTVSSNKGYRGARRTRVVYLDDQALALLRRLASGKRPDQHLLTTVAGGPWAKSVHIRRVKAAVEKAGLDPDTNLYALRHSYISRALRVGVPVKAVADQCGTSIAMIQKHYAKHIPGDQQRYAAMAAPAISIADADAKVVPLRAS
jgi:integrase